MPYSEKDKIQFLLGKGFSIDEIMESLSSIDENPSNLNENDKKVSEPLKEETPTESRSEASQNALEKQLEDLKAEIKTLRESVHRKNRTEDTVDTQDMTKKTTIEEDVESLIKMVEG